MQSGNKKSFPHAMTFKELIIYIIFTILVGVFFFFTRGDMAGKMVAFMVCPMLIAYLIYAYLKEKKADKAAVQTKESITSGDYFDSPEWHGKYVEYINSHPFEKPKYPSMKKDLLKRYQTKDKLLVMLFMLFLMFCCCCALYSRYNIVIIIVGFAFFRIFLLS